MSGILNADHLAEQEQAYLETGEAPEQHVLTLAEVIDRLRRIAYHKRKIAEEEAEAEALIAPLQAEIDRIREWQKERRERRERIIQLHENACIAYYRLNPPAKGKTMKLPNGAISARTSRGKIAFADDKLAAYQLEKIAPQFVRHTPAVDKQALYEAMNTGKVRVEGEQVYVITEDGEMVLLEGAKWEAPQEQITVKVEEE